METKFCTYLGSNLLAVKESRGSVELCLEFDAQHPFTLQKQNSFPAVIQYLLYSQNKIFLLEFFDALNLKIVIYLIKTIFQLIFL